MDTANPILDLEWHRHFEDVADRCVGAKMWVADLVASRIALTIVPVGAIMTTQQAA